MHRQPKCFLLCTWPPVSGCYVATRRRSPIQTLAPRTSRLIRLIRLTTQLSSALASHFKLFYLPLPPQPSFPSSNHVSDIFSFTLPLPLNSISQLLLPSCSILQIGSARNPALLSRQLWEPQSLALCLTPTTADHQLFHHLSPLQARHGRAVQGPAIPPPRSNRTVSFAHRTEPNWSIDKSSTYVILHALRLRVVRPSHHGART